MATCVIAQRGVFSADHGNYWAYGYNVPALIIRVESLLKEARPELIWQPNAGEMCVECSSLRQARAENPVQPIEILMEDLWEQAAKEQFERMTPEQQDFAEMVGKARDFSEVQKLQENKDVICRTVKGIAAAAGISCRQLAERFHVPYRTMENWSSGCCKCPLYTRLMMQQCLGLYTPPNRTAKKENNAWHCSSA